MEKPLYQGHLHKQLDLAQISFLDTKKDIMDLDEILAIFHEEPETEFAGGDLECSIINFLFEGAFSVQLFI
ncbi:hypothetical protein MTR_2g060043 [Medicago truncatula]|uniref:Uncharacterized protein n=1 Tax=Medicago truncatula TaxID=3880 RepID=A0A072VIR7_MEDTR|nr:hypothetical protein MTR_2g060043 [Medicago truncatula]